MPERGGAAKVAVGNCVGVGPPSLGAGDRGAPAGQRAGHVAAPK